MSGQHRRTDIRSLVNAIDKRKLMPEYVFSGKVFYSVDESNRTDAVEPDDYGRKQKAQ